MGDTVDVVEAVKPVVGDGSAVTVVDVPVGVETLGVPVLGVENDVVVGVGTDVVVVGDGSLVTVVDVPVLVGEEGIVGVVVGRSRHCPFDKKHP